MSGGHTADAGTADEADLSPEGYAPEVLLGDRAADLHPTAYKLLTTIGLLNELGEMIDESKRGLTRDETTALGRRQQLVRDVVEVRMQLVEDLRSDKLQEHLERTERLAEETKAGAAASFDEALTLPRKEGT